MTRRALLLQTIFGKFRRRIVVTYIVTLAENLFEFCYPSLTGLAVNGLLKHDFTGLWVAARSLVRTHRNRGLPPKL